MHLFYTPDIQNTDTYTLSEEESKHCIKVLRLQASDLIYLIDGTGGFYKSEIVEPDAKRTLLKILERTFEYGKRNHYLHIAVAPTKNIERFEWFLEKATEIGIDEITPIICERSERRDVKIERLNKVIVSAVKQSIKAYHPKLNEAVKLTNFLSGGFIGDKYIAHCVESEKQSLKSVIRQQHKYLILIGPEGDFSDAEIAKAMKEKYIPVSLGNSRLRTETAALEACFEINFLNR